MKFVAIQHFKDSFFTLPDEKRASLLQGAMVFGDKYLKTGGCKELYIFSDMKGSVSFWDIDTAEEEMHIAFEYPLSPYIEMELIPVVEYTSASKIMKESMATMQKKAAQKVPAMSR